MAGRSTSERIARMLRAPAVHFLVIGFCLFLVRTYGPAAVDPSLSVARESIVLDQDRIEELRRRHIATRGEPPDADAEAYMIEKEIDDELLYREALALGLDRTDRTVYWRLVEKMRFLGEAREGESDDQLFRRAIDIGLHASDPIVRHVLIRKLSMLIRFATHEGAPPEEALHEYYARHQARYTRPERVTIQHVFFSCDRRGTGTRDSARRVLSELRKESDGDAQAARRGDPFLAGHVFESSSRDGLAKLFGEGFADRVMQLPQGTWEGPIESAFGVHLVLVRDRSESGRMPLASVRSQVLEGLEEERRAARLKTKLAELRGKYGVRIEHPAAGTKGDA